MKHDGVASSGFQAKQLHGCFYGVEGFAFELKDRQHLFDIA